MTDALGTELQGYIDRMNAGDCAARDELLRHVGARLQRLAHKMVGDFHGVRRWEETGDVLQNAVLRLLQALQVVKIDSARQFFRLAALQIRRELLDLARHYFGPEGIGANQATGFITCDGNEPRLPVYDQPASTHDPAKIAVWTEFHGQVEALPDEDRDVFDLLWYQDLTQAQAAKILDVSIPTVKRRWLAARLRLQTALTKDSGILEGC